MKQFASVESASADVFTIPRYSHFSFVSSVSKTSSVMPRMPFMGVRISWLIFARGWLLTRLAAAAAERGHLLVDVNDGGRRKSVEPGGRGIAVGADVFRIDQIIDLEVGQLLGLRDGVQTIAGLPVDGADFGGSFFKRLEM